MRKELRNVKRWARGSMTVEMSFLMPMILLMIMSGILASFYFHDKNIIAGAAYETAVVGSTKMREEKGVTTAELQALYQERIGGKCILFPESKARISLAEEEISVEAEGKRGRFGVSVSKKAAVTKPEEHIRNLRRIEEISNGTNGDD